MDRERYRRQAEELVAKMTVEEAASQLLHHAPAIERLGVPEYNWWNEALHGVGRAGIATVFPQAIGMAAAFDPDFLKREAEINRRGGQGEVQRGPGSGRQGYL